MGNYTTFGGCENPRRGRQARNLTTNVPKILDLESNRLQNRYFPKNFGWVLLFLLHLLLLSEQNSYYSPPLVGKSHGEDTITTQFEWKK